MRSPLLEGFCRAVRPDFYTVDEIRGLASRWQCGTRTIRRLIAREVDVRDPAALAFVLAGQRNVSRPMLAAVLAELEIHP